MFRPKCVATTVQSPTDDAPGDSQLPVPKSYFKSAQWSADGTCLIASRSNNDIDTFVVPADLLEKAPEPRILSPYCSIQSAESVKAVVGYPFFNLQDSSTTLILSSMRDHPIRLTSALTGHLGASYPLVNPMTEGFISPHSLMFSSQGDRIIAGSESLISIFDVNRPGQDPVSSIPTGPKWRKAAEYTGTVNMRGIVSTLSGDPSTGLLAAGTYSRYVALYDSLGQGDCVGVFCVKGTAADLQIGGGGITQVLWSPCGRYLHIAERKSNGVMLYDIRKTGQLLAWLEGRAAMTNQRLGIDLVGTDDQSNEVWAGGLDGVFRMWKDPQQREGPIASTFEFNGHSDAVSSVVVHHRGGVLATSSGQRHVAVEYEDVQMEETMPDYNLKIWEL
ncbi:uncharacterized protein PV07_01221 [Cladophialophora immunda]|uniref:Anaphase-promoting complex subunit 4 WD40 domain-containing protein n=1 Tax=Cladophialophora immunda TaxID=569365 RepID=A0A0D2CTG5_9EURO|nr:uncharacterized protein PV07_01221 [Cladophialophora immunda]KIW34443.1 hypothetical protein PV07_01221 [Cladophialophora immunda]OQV06964.1 WD domain-containing protein [Cladophialophora immunda]